MENNKKITTNLKIISWNKGPSRVKNTINNLRHIVTTHKPHIMAIQEYNLTDTDDINQLNIPGYKIELDTLMEENGIARTALIISDDIKYSRRLDMQNCNDSQVIITIHLTRNKKINIISHYRQWRTLNKAGSIKNSGTMKNQKIRLKKSLQVWQKAAEENETIILSDTNLNTTQFEKPLDEWTDYEVKLKPLTDMLRETMNSQNLTIIKTVSTRDNNFSTPSTIDHIITNRPQQHNNTTTLESMFSDHSLLITQRLFKVPVISPRYYNVQKIHKIDKDEMETFLSQHPGIRQAEMTTSPHETSELLQSVIQEALEKYAPITRVQANNKLPQVATARTLKTIKERDQVYKEYKTTGDTDTKRLYNNLRNQVKKELNEDQDKKEIRDMEQSTNARQQWTTAKKKLGWTKSTGPKLLITEGKTTQSPKAMATILNKTYLTRAADLYRSVPKTDIDPLVNFNKLTEDKELKFDFKIVDNDTILQTLKQINPSMSSSNDKIPMKFISLFHKPLLKSLTTLVNNTIITQQYPNSLKETKIIPLLKPGKNPNDPKSFRGINLSPALSKIIDKTYQLQLSEHLIQNNLISQHHHGNVRGASTTTALLTLLDTWTQSLERGDDLLTLLVDQSAAFDIVDHKIFMRKLESLGLSTKALSLMRDYLHNRQQSVCVDTYTSEYLHSNPMSVIQGSGLSCLFYLIYTMDLPLIFSEKVKSTLEDAVAKKDTEATTYVDDTTVNMIKKTRYNDATNFR